MRLFVPPPLNDRETFTISIEQQQFVLTYTYNDRSDAWYINLAKDNVNVLENIKLTQGYKFGQEYRDFPLTQGFLTLYSQTNSSDDPNKSNFGKTVFLVYESES
jgi:hypothetical protein